MEIEVLNESIPVDYNKFVEETKTEFSFVQISVETKEYVQLVRENEINSSLSN